MWCGRHDQGVDRRSDFMQSPIGIVIKGVTVASVGTGSVAALIAVPGDVVVGINGTPTTASTADVDKDVVKEVRHIFPAPCRWRKAWRSNAKPF